MKDRQISWSGIIPGRRRFVAFELAEHERESRLPALEVEIAGQGLHLIEEGLAGGEFEAYLAILLVTQVQHGVKQKGQQVKGHVILDRRLYLPAEWCNDAERRAQAKIPAEVVFQTKPEQAMGMLEHAWQAGVPMRWAAGDALYGESTPLRDLIADRGRWYMLTVRSDAPVWTERPAVEPPAAPPTGRPRTEPRLAAADDGESGGSPLAGEPLAEPGGGRRREGLAHLRLGLPTGRGKPRWLAGAGGVADRRASERDRPLPVQCARRQAALEAGPSSLDPLHD